MAIGNIIMVAAVFEIQRLINPVASINPRTMRAGLLPTRAMIASAIRRCKPHCCMEAAIIMPPRNRKLIGSTYCNSTAGSAAVPQRGKTTRGIQAVSHSGTGSVIHQITIQATAAAVHRAGPPSPPAVTPKAKNRTGPRASPMRCLIVKGTGEVYRERESKQMERANA